MAKRYTPRTRIVCTLGPASTRETTLRKMMRAGMDVARLNFSHGNHAGHLSRIETVRALNRKYRRRIRLLGDLEGPRIRLGYFRDREPVPLEKNRKLSLVPMDDKGDGRSRVPFDYEGPFSDLAGAGLLYIDDGNIVLRVGRITETVVETRVVVGGILKERKALNAPGAELCFPCMTEKDKRDIEFAVSNRLDFLAMSFVRTERDAIAVRKQLSGRIPQCRIIAKIENRDGIENIDGIIRAADGIMIARGDMGVCVPIHEVPLIQKSILRKCRAARRLSITATQMLEHMVEFPTPTRAEVTDIANAVLDGTDCVMLSAETAVGKYPAEAVAMMNQIVKYTEQHAPRG